ncbi:MAG: tripartite tricarboxylate transporter substrate binding protein [Gammaproteobacteria bacterium]|nr:tripartite tricarboxylate transporter substrate binding protein [Gammaproteobacteria bacterium]
MRQLLHALLFAAALVLAGGAHAQDYPNRNITIVVPFAAGSGSDTAARIIGQQLSEKLKQGVVIENRVGVTGALAAAHVAKSPADGYTLLLGTNSTHGSNSALYKKQTYDPVQDFAAVAHTGDFGYFLVVDPALPITSTAELVAYGKANPGKLSYGAGSSTSIVMSETFSRGVGVELLKVPYRSNPPALTDVMGGRVSLMFVDISSSIALVDDGKLRALAVMSKDRSALRPDMPTIDETALKGFDLASWTGLFAPAGTPAPVVAKLNAEVNAILTRPDIKEQLFKIGIEPKPKSVAEFTPFVAAEVAKWIELVKLAGIEPQ